MRDPRLNVPNVLSAYRLVILPVILGTIVLGIAAPSSP